jgi:tungstate transport system substrate-binding protein
LEKPAVIMGANPLGNFGRKSRSITVQEVPKMPAPEDAKLILRACAVVLAFCSVLLGLALMLGHASDSILTIATTTSIDNSGLLDQLIPAFERKYEVKLRYMAVGTGEAIRMACDGNADLIFVHDRKREEAFLDDGYGLARYEIMKNYFTLVGPKSLASDFADRPICETLKEIAERKLNFISRGDESGTHSKEKELWQRCGITWFGSWYLETGSGMTATLRVANEKRAFTLTDTATYQSHRDELALVPYWPREPALTNIYTLIPVSPKKLPNTRLDLARKFIRFVLKEEGREIIKIYGQETYGEPLFSLLEKP